MCSHLVSLRDVVTCAFWFVCVLPLFTPRYNDYLKVCFTHSSKVMTPSVVCTYFQTRKEAMLFKTMRVWQFRSNNSSHCLKLRSKLSMNRSTFLSGALRYKIVVIRSIIQSPTPQRHFFLHPVLQDHRSRLSFFNIIPTLSPYHKSWFRSHIHQRHP